MIIYKKWFLSLGVISLFILSCKKFNVTTLHDEAVFEVKQWLHKNGGIYKYETIQIQSIGGDNVNGKLNWSKTIIYTYQGRRYFSIPFELNNYGESLPAKENIVGSTSFRMIIRTDPAYGYEGAIRTTSPNGIVLNAVNGKTEIGYLAYYSNIKDNSPADGWYQNNDQLYHSTSRSAVHDKVYSYISTDIALLLNSKNQYKSIRSALVGKSSGTASLAPGANCQDVYSTSWETVCVAHPNGTDYNVTCSSIPTTVVTTYCQDDGSGGTETGSGGGSGVGTVWPPDDAPTSPEDPCEQAKKAAIAMSSAFGQQVVKDGLAKIGDVTKLAVENGFAIMEKVKVDPNDPTKISADSYTATNPVQSTTIDNIDIPVAVTSLIGEVGTVHTHLTSAFSAPSPPDIYDVISASTTNFGNFTKNVFVGNFIVAADGSVYGLVITDPGAAAQFFLTKADNLSGTHWKPDTEIGKAFNDVNYYFTKQFKNQANQNNLAFENAMAAVLNQFKTGVMMVKKDPATGTFNPLQKKIMPDPNKPKNNIYVNPCGA